LNDVQIEAWDAALRSCNFVLRLQPDNVKALFRKAKVAPALVYYITHLQLSAFSAYDQIRPLAATITIINYRMT